MNKDLSAFEKTIIYLIGYAGVGKLTIGQSISSRTGMCLVDNHLINNPIFSLIATDGKTPLPISVWNRVSQVWEAVYSTIEEISPKILDLFLQTSY